MFSNFNGMNTPISSYQCDINWQENYENLTIGSRKPIQAGSKTPLNYAIQYWKLNHLQPFKQGIQISKFNNPLI